MVTAKYFHLIAEGISETFIVRRILRLCNIEVLNLKVNEACYNNDCVATRVGAK
jgi:hypothetical protein